MSTHLPGVQPPHHDANGGALCDTLPNYEVLDLIGRGGMGMVYKARQVSLDRIVAIKLLPREIIRDDIDFKQRFKLEAQTMARLSHPGIVAVHDFGETEDGQLFFVMEFIDGQDLAKLIEQRGALPVDEVLRIFRAVAEALVYAHREGVIHRDIKPANVLIKASGEVKVADFGLAKIVAPGTVALTATSTSMGSHDFAAPEVFAHGADADHRADVFSLGVMLYQMLTGTIPRGMFKLPSERVPELGSRFDEIVCMALEQDREDRFQSVSEMLEALHLPATEALAVVARDAPRALAVTTPVRRLSWPRVAMAAALIVLAAGYWFWPPSQRARPSEGWTDVLSQVDLKQHLLDGYWRMINGELQNRFDIGHGVVELPMAPKGGYDLRVRLTCVRDGGGHSNILFRYRDCGGDLSFTDYATPRVGLASFDGKKASEHGLLTERLTRFLTLGQPREILLRVRDEGLTVDLDGEEVYRWTGDWARMTQDTVVIQDRVKGRKIFGIYAHTQRIVVHEVAWRDAPGPLPAAPADVPPKAEPITRVFPGNGHRYQLVPGSFTWKEANSNATSQGGHLATITSAEENDWVWRTFSAHLPSVAVRNIHYRGWWIGGSQEDGGKPWTWVTGETFEFVRWAEGHPSRAKPGAQYLRQRDNGGGGELSSWMCAPATSRANYLIEWDEPLATEDSDARKLVAWVLSLPLSTEPSHMDHKVPDVMIEGSLRNLRKVSELPTTPFALSRLRIGPLPTDDTARQHLDILARQTRLYDLRIYAAEDAEVLAAVRPLTRLGTFVFKAMPGKARALTDEQLASLDDLVNLNSLRLEGWSSMTGSGFAAFKNRRKLSSLTLNDCPDLNDAGLAEIARFTSLETLSLLGAVKLTDAGLLQLKTLKQLKSLGLGIRTKFSDKALAELKLALPQCLVNTGG